MIFKNKEHKQFYYEQLAKSSSQDCYHRALFYALGINEDTRNHINEIYDFDTRCIKHKALKAGWITSSDARAMRLAFNLYTDSIPEERNKERYAPSEIFCGSDVEYLCEAIAVRYCNVGVSGND